MAKRIKYFLKWCSDNINSVVVVDDDDGVDGDVDDEFI